MRKTAPLSILVVVLAAAMIAEAQQGGKVPRIGVLIPGSRAIAKPRVKAFQEGLRELGYVEGKNIVVSTAMRKVGRKLSPSASTSLSNSTST